jgi:hypothetical protein
MRSPLLLLALGSSLALAACGDPDKPDDTGSIEAADADGDGYDTETDCDDADPAVHPGAEERCDSADNDCDGEVDEDASDAGSFYADRDGDGFGDASSAVIACEQPSGTVDDASDCDDDDGAINPAADETCDGDDNDCDGLVDDEDGDLIDASTWYEDADDDGWGDDSSSAEACEAPSGFVEQAGDCDDGDPAFNPGASEDDCTDPADYNCDGSTGYADVDGDGYPACEDCDDGSDSVYPGADEYCDGLDNDCDGTVDDAAVDARTWYTDADGDGRGDGGTGVAACTQPSGAVADGSDCDDTDDGIWPGAPELCDGEDNDCDGTVDEDDAVDADTWYIDYDGDGYGSPSYTAVACAQPSGYADNDDDCDDSEAGVNPGEVEQCDGADNDCDGDVDEDSAADASTWYIDYDGDGFGSSAYTTVACVQPGGWVGNSDDCEDADAASHPGADEYCDGVDNDCDGSVDEDSALDASVFYADSDGDGYGDPLSTTLACTAGTGWTADSTDCDDGAPAIHPGADEYCDGQDTDCDGILDEDEALDAGRWYEDVDGDGYGDPGSSTEACSQPTGWLGASVATDCDDTDPTIHPGADEYCDGVDTDCDGTADDGDVLDFDTWYSDLDGDGYGDVSTAVDACSQPSGSVEDGTDCDDTDSTAYPGADEYCDGVDNDCDGSVDEDDALDTSTWYLDADGDGYGDEDDTLQACDEPSGYCDNPDDCDDSDASIVECTFRVFDGTTGTSWESLGSCPTDLFALQSYHSESEYDVIYNTHQSTAAYYDPSTDGWTSVSSSAPYTGTWTQMAPWDGKLWMIRNGYVYSYDPSSDYWDTVSSTSWRDDANMTESDEYGVLYGYDSAGNVAVYDTTTGAQSSYATGLGSEYETRLGYDPISRAVFFGYFAAGNLYRFDIATGAITAVSSHPEAYLNDIFCSDRSGHIYAAGGSSGKTMWQYDIASDSWSSIPDFPVDHGNNWSCTVSDTGWLYVGAGKAFYRLELY